jgi:hypothetical protein
MDSNHSFHHSCKMQSSLCLKLSPTHIGATPALTHLLGHAYLSPVIAFSGMHCGRHARVTSSSHLCHSRDGHAVAHTQTCMQPLSTPQELSPQPMATVRSLARPHSPQQHASRGPWHLSQQLPCLHPLTLSECMSTQPAFPRSFLFVCIFVCVCLIVLLMSTHHRVSTPSRHTRD